MYKRLLFFCFVALIASSCGDKPTDLSQYDPMFREVLKSDSGLFRSIELGMSMEEVRKSENMPLAGADDMYLYYDIFLSDDSTNSYTLAYNFDNTGLTTIEMDLYPESEERSKLLMSQFSQYFKGKYGDGIGDKGFITWKTKHGGREIAFSMADESEATDSPLLSLSIYPLED